MPPEEYRRRRQLVSLATALATAPFYDLSTERAREVVKAVVKAVEGWEDAAKRAGIALDSVLGVL